jgi:hypothetical protein
VVVFDATTGMPVVGMSGVMVPAGMTGAGAGTGAGTGTGAGAGGGGGFGTVAASHGILIG